jgi:hypothetical protein
MKEFSSEYKIERGANYHLLPVPHILGFADSLASGQVAEA